MVALFVCGLLLTAQTREDAAARISRVLIQQFPEWKTQGGRPFPPRGTMIGNWSEGARKLSILIEPSVSGDALKRDYEWFLFVNREMPQNREVTGVGDLSRLFEYNDRVEVGFASAKDSLWIVVTLHFPPASAVLGAPAPREEVEKAIAIARAIFSVVGLGDPARSAANIQVTFSKSTTPPATGIPVEARGAGVEPETAGPRDPSTSISFGVVRQPYDQGPLSRWVNGKIGALEVTWADPRVFHDNEQITTFLRNRLAATTGTSFTFVAWSGGLGLPALTANVRHLNGKVGKLYIWSGGNEARYAYLNGDGDWWFGGWQNVTF
jgi:hypothetical protein